MSKRHIAHDPTQVAHIAAILLAGHAEPHFAVRDAATRTAVVAGARALLDEANLPPPLTAEEKAEADAAAAFGEQPPGPDKTEI